MPIQPGESAPAVPGLDPRGTTALVFYKVTCPTCQLAAPAMEHLHRAGPSRFAAVVQDPPERAVSFASEFGTTFEPVSDAEPYELSDAFGIRTVPTVFLLNEGRVDDVVESWDRDGWNRLAKRLEQLTGDEVGVVSSEGDGLPPFKPG
ncbi:MAG TPA: hypothetical protein VGB51_09955 [Actinomycetota bacterium]